MLTRLSAMVQDVGIVTTRVFKSITKDWHILKAALMVDMSGHQSDARLTPNTKTFAIHNL
jgi:hypothetical protein